jgi:hypothetical protein
MRQGIPCSVKKVSHSVGAGYLEALQKCQSQWRGIHSNLLISFHNHVIRLSRCVRSPINVKFGRRTLHTYVVRLMDRHLKYLAKSYPAERQAKLHSLYHCVLRLLRLRRCRKGGKRSARLQVQLGISFWIISLEDLTTLMDHDGPRFPYEVGSQVSKP